MLLDLVDSSFGRVAQALFWQLVRQSLYQVLKLFGEVVSGGHVPESDVVGHCVEVFALEGRRSRRKLKEHDSERPPVRLRVVTLLTDHFRRHVLGRAADRESFALAPHPLQLIDVVVITQIAGRAQAGNTSFQVVFISFAR